MAESSLPQPSTATSSITAPHSVRPTLSTSQEPHHSLIAINVTAQAPLKLTATNYAAWRAQFNSLLIGYDLLGYVDGTLPCPAATLPSSDLATPVPNPDFALWIRQDQLLLNAILGSVSPNLVPFIASSSSARAAWLTLEKTYASPSRGRIMELSGRLAHLSQGPQTITAYMQDIKTCVDSLALMNKPVDFDDLSIHILNGLDSAYSKLSHALQVRDTLLDFDELFEKLLNYEAQLKLMPSSPAAPATAFTAFTGSQPHRTQRFGSQPRSSQRPHFQPPLPPPPAPAPLVRSPALWSPRPPAPFFGQLSQGYHGTCQICGTVGHSARQCSLVPPSLWASLPPAPPRSPPALTTTSPHGYLFFAGFYL
ncbi:hypothetical protein J5N97_015255 [Dioscorea zingiberensis]|uniref:CCHC-type domain-containing protein n=1 Tax=Dioscorea zingiberensis TaxID=325984 RepID=A0A9D5CUD0_9LILI|nr:hypothetical protein J5N97_015255 [Dioscorea zingiberensis]